VSRRNLQVVHKCDGGLESGTGRVCIGEMVCSTIEGKYARGGSIDSSVKNEEVLGKLLWMLLYASLTRT